MRHGEIDMRKMLRQWQAHLLWLWRNGKALRRDLLDKPERLLALPDVRGYGKADLRFLRRHRTPLMATARVAPWKAQR